MDIEGIKYEMVGGRKVPISDRKREAPKKAMEGFKGKVEAAELAKEETVVAKAEEANGESAEAAGTESACAVETENLEVAREDEPVKKGRRGRKVKKAADGDVML